MNASYSEKTSYRIKQEIIFSVNVPIHVKWDNRNISLRLLLLATFFKFVANFWKK